MRRAAPDHCVPVTFTLNLMQISPHALRKTAAVVLLIPAAVALLAQALILLLPGCNPNPYALGECMLAGFNIAGLLVIVGTGGFAIAVVIALCVSLPLFVASVLLGRLRRRKVGQDV